MSLTRRSLLKNSAIFATALPLGYSNASATELHRQINELIRNRRGNGLVDWNERTAWSVYDLSSNKKLVSINEDRSLQAASMVKVFVALAYFYLHQQNPNKYPYGFSEKRHMQKMLVKSSNKSTNTLIEKCAGPHNVQRLCQVATGGIFKQLRIVEYIPANGRTYKNKASAKDYSRFLYAIWHNKLPYANELKRIMSMRNNDRIRTNTNLPDDLTIYDKTGSTGMLCGNIGIVEINENGENKAYTFIAIVERGSRTTGYSRWIKNRGRVIRDVSELTYSFMRTRYNLIDSVNISIS